MVSAYYIEGFYVTVKNTSIPNIPACKEFLIFHDDGEYSTGVLNSGSNEIIYLAEYNGGEPGVSRVAECTVTRRDMMTSMGLKGTKQVQLHCSLRCKYILKTTLPYKGKVAKPTPIGFQEECTTRDNSECVLF